MERAKARALPIARIQALDKKEKASMDEENEELRRRRKLLTARRQHCCCKYCGGPLEIRKMVFTVEDDARIELYCPTCRKLEYGVEREVFAVAEYYVDEMGLQVFDGIEDTALCRNFNVAKVADVLQWGLGNMGYVDDERGFLSPVATPESHLHEYMEAKLEQLEEVDSGEANHRA